MVPEDDDGQEYEYGDLEAHAMDANTADYSIHQFIAPDEARDPMGSDDSEQDAAHNDAARSKILSRETFDSEDVPSPDNFLQKSRKAHLRMMPRDDDDDGDEFEHGDLEAHAMDANTADYSIHQFIAPDEARDPMGSDDSEQDAAHNDAMRSKILSAETFDSEDTPSPDNFIQKSRKSHRRMMPRDDDDDGDEFEHGDLEAHAMDANTADYSIHQFIAPDEARDPMGSDDSEQDAAHNDAMRSKILSAETFDSEDTPSPDNFLQKSRKSHRRMMPRDDDDDGDEFEHGDLEAHAMDANTADYSIHQFIAPDEARDPMGSDDSEQDAAHNDAMRSKILSAETFDSEDTPSPDNFIQKSHKAHRRMMPRDDDDDGDEFEHGDLEAHAMDANTADYSIHQFIAPDEARDPMGSDDSEQDAAHNDAMRSKILSAETFDSEDTPSPDNFIQKSRKTHRRMMPRDDDDDGDEFEHGDLEAHAMDANTADYSIHQFIAPDEARDPMGSDDSEQDAAHNDAMRSKILSAETFDSEDTPSPDNFLQKSRKSHRRMMPRDDDDDGDEFEHGDLEAHAMDANTADYSIHQFIAPDEARDPMGSDDSEQDAAHNDAMRSKILSAETFDSEDTPSPDN